MDFYSLPKRCSLKIGVMCCFLHVRKKGAENDQYKRNVYQLGRRWKQKVTDSHNNNIPYLYRAKQKKKLNLIYLMGHQNAKTLKNHQKMRKDVTLSS